MQPQSNGAIPPVVKQDPVETGRSATEPDKDRNNAPELPQSNQPMSQILVLHPDPLQFANSIHYLHSIHRELLEPAPKPATDKAKVAKKVYKRSKYDISDPKLELRKSSTPETSYSRRPRLVKIVPPATWRMPFVLDTEEVVIPLVQQERGSLPSLASSSFAQLNHDQNTFLKRLHSYHRDCNTPINKIPSVNRTSLDMHCLFDQVQIRGGFDAVCKGKMWAQVGRSMGFAAIKPMTSLSTSLKSAYMRYLQNFEPLELEYRRTVLPHLSFKQNVKFQELRALNAARTSAIFSSADTESGSPELQTGTPSPDEVERMYWKISDHHSRRSGVGGVPTEWGRQLSSIIHGSGFPQLDRHVDALTRDPWNLTVLPFLDGSLCQYISEDVGDLFEPWLDFNTIFSGDPFPEYQEKITDPIDVKEHIKEAKENKYVDGAVIVKYLHCGDPVIWYVCDAETTKDTRDPHQLARVSKKCIQRPGEFVIIYPGSRTMSISCGFNVMESVRYLDRDWLQEYHDGLYNEPPFSVEKLIWNIQNKPQ